MTNAKVIEAKQTEEQVHFSSSPGRSGSGFTRRSSRNHGNGAGRHGHDQRQHSSFEQRGSRSCGFCGANERHSRRNCPANKPVVVCSNCGGRNPTLPRCAEVQRITSSAVPLLSQPMHWTMLPQQRRIAVMTLNTFVWMNQFMRCHHRHPSCLQRFLCLYLVILSWMLSFKWIQLLPATLCRIISSRKSARTQICNPPRPS